MQLNKKVESTGNGPRELYIGFLSGNTIAANPSTEEIAALYGNEVKADAKEQEYDGTDKDSKDYITFSFYLEADTPGKEIFNQRIRVTDKEVVSKSGKVQYVNQSGQSAYVDNVEDLQGFFTHFQEADPNDPETDWKKKKKINVAPKVYRPALQGEAQLYEFLTCYIHPSCLLKKDEETGEYGNILIDVKKAFRNIESFVKNTIRPLINSELVTPVTIPAQIRTADKDGKVVHYQSLGKPLPASIKDGTRYSSTISVLKICAATGDWNSNPTIKKYIADNLTGEYGTKDTYSLSMLHKWDPSSPDNPISTTSETLRIEEETGTGNSVATVSTDY